MKQDLRLGKTETGDLIRSRRSRNAAFEAGLGILMRDGLGGLTFGALSRERGISKSGLRVNSVRKPTSSKHYSRNSKNILDRLALVSCRRKATLFAHSRFLSDCCGAGIDQIIELRRTGYLRRACRGAESRWQNSREYRNKRAKYCHGNQRP